MKLTETLPLRKIFFSCLFLTVGVFAFSSFSEAGKTFEDYKKEVEVLNKEKRYKEMETLLGDLTKEFPNQSIFFIKSYYRAAIGYYEAEKINEAKEITQKALTSYPSDRSLRIIYARILIRLENISTANKILKEYPHEFGNFLQDMQISTLELWARYDLAACYSLLKDSNMSFAYASTVFFSQSIPEPDDLIRILNAFEEESDFIFLRQDKRYIELKRMILSSPFDAAIVDLGNHFEQVGKTLNAIKRQEMPVAIGVTELVKAKNDISNIQTVAPALIEVQRKIIVYLDDMLKILNSSSLIPESFDSRYESIVQDISAARMSQG